MCGILGIITPKGTRTGLSPASVLHARDLMAHRGPDGAGLWTSPDGSVTLAHRRLAIVDPTPAGAQPFVLEPGSNGWKGPHAALTYNGELYNDTDLRPPLIRAGHRFRSESDTETLIRAGVDASINNTASQWATSLLRSLRGMFGLGLWVDGAGLLLARDPLGIKPLYMTRVDASTGAGTKRIPHLMFSSEIRPLLQLRMELGLRPKPDAVGVASYLMTIRTTLDNRTMFEGIETLAPGGWRVIDERTLAIAAQGIVDGAEVHAPVPTLGGAAARARGVMSESVRLHLRSDVPTCALLSGGLDSSIICAEASGRVAGLRTYCSGARSGGHGSADDFGYAAMVAECLGVSHTEAPVDRSMFEQCWTDLVESRCVPLSTPNEVAIYEVARTLRAAGNKVALSGEGADELFAGYAAPMTNALAFERGLKDVHASVAEGGVFQLHDGAWVPPEMLAQVVSAVDSPIAMARRDVAEKYRATFARCAELAGPGLPAHLEFLRMMNLSGLLLRLDSSTMAAGVEGRTPFADAAVLRFARSLPMDQKFSNTDTTQSTKRVLRDAYEGVLPSGVVRRAKASFPLPFQEWMDSVAREVLLETPFIREQFNMPLVAAIANSPGTHWRVAWPLVNLALWARSIEGITPFDSADNPCAAVRDGEPVGPCGL